MGESSERDNRVFLECGVVDSMSGDRDGKELCQ